MLVCESVDFTNTLAAAEAEWSMLQMHNGKNCLMLEAGELVPLVNHDGRAQRYAVVVGTTQRVSWA